MCPLRAAESAAATVPFLVRYRKQVLMLAICGLLAGSAGAANAPEIQRRINNGQRVRMLKPYMQPKVAAILSDLESHGDKPTIDPAVIRTKAQQAALVKKGRSTVKFSFHNVGLAADIPDYYKGYNVGNDYWLRLASSAQTHDLETGITWRLTQAERNKIQTLIKTKSWKTPYTRGWDPSHVEPKPAAITLNEAARGLVPPVKRK